MYETLQMLAHKNGLVVKEKPLQANKGRIKNNNIAIKEDLSLKEKTCVLAEEIGHSKKNHGNILDQSKIENRKQEIRARNWAYEKLIPLEKFIEAYKTHSIKNSFEFAEFLDVTQDFLESAIRYYQKKYGLYTIYQNYTIHFDPVGVLDINDFRLDI